MAASQIELHLKPPISAYKRRYRNAESGDIIEKARWNFAGDNAERNVLFSDFGVSYMSYRLGLYNMQKHHVIEAAERIIYNYTYEENPSPLVAEKAARLIEMMQDAVDQVLEPQKIKSVELAHPASGPLSKETCADFSGKARRAVKREMAKSFGYTQQGPRKEPILENIKTSHAIEDLAGVYAGYRCGHFVEADVRHAENAVNKAIGRFCGPAVVRKIYQVADKVIDNEIDVPARGREI